VGIFIWDYDARLSRIVRLTDEANRLTALVREANSDTRTWLNRSSFRVIYSDKTDTPDRE
jgi:hypothetical protein